MAQTIKIKRGGVGNIASLTLSTGEIALATGSLAAGIASNPFIIAGNSGNTLPVGAILTGSSTPSVNAKLNGALFYNSTDKQLIRLDSAGNQNLDIAATVENALTAGDGIFYDGSTGGTFDGSTALTISIDSGSIAINDLDTSTDLSVANGGTGVSTLTDHGVLVGSGANPITALSVGSNGQLLIGQTGADPSFNTVTGVININSTGTTTFTATANTAISGAFTSTSASIAADIASNFTQININTTGISTNANNIASLTAATSSYLLAADLDGVVSASVLSSPSQGTVTLTTNGVANNVDTGLQTGDSPQFTDLTLTGGDLIASTSTTFNVFNTTATTVNAFGAATAITIGASTGTATIKNATINLGETSGDIVNIKGNLNVAGTTTTVNSTTVNIDDNIIVLNYGGSETDGGIHVTDGPNTGSLLWDGTNNYWKGGALGSEKRVILEGASAGTANTVVKFDAAGTVVNSTITDNGNDISLGGNVTITSGHTLTAPNAVTFSGLTGATNNTSAQVAFVGSDGKLGEVATAVDSSATATGFLAYSSDNVLEFVSTIDGGTF